jgi:beta-lactamase superfamily II metal-dependent hydrolase
MRIKVLKAFNGDSSLVSFNDIDGVPRNIVIDGGIGENYMQAKGSKGKPVFGELKKCIDEIKNAKQHIDLLILTHIDDDHIGGILKWFKYDKAVPDLVKEVWFNSGGLIAEYFKEKENKELEIHLEISKTNKTSIKQGKEFGEFIYDKNIILQGDELERFGVKFSILSPDKVRLKKLLKEWTKKDPALKTAAKKNDYGVSISDHIVNDSFDPDTAIANGSSIAFILTWEERNFLFLADAHPSVIVEGLNGFGFSGKSPLICELVKVSHHGSSGNTSVSLLSCINCSEYIISTNGNGHQHPHKQMLTRLISQKPECKIWFTYKERMEMIFSEKDRKEHNEFTICEITKDFEY